MLLPIWHNLTLEEVLARSPILADRLAVSTAQGISFLVEQIIAVLEPNEPPRTAASVSPPPPQPKLTVPPNPGQERIHEVDRSVLVYVPGGEYVLGANDLSTFEKPVHRVILSPFWIGKYQVTNDQYARFLRAVHDAPQPEHWNDNRFNQPLQPVVGVGWEEARDYCRWAGLELPNEAQWEAAARGADRRRYPWGNEKPTRERASFGMVAEKGQPTPVGALPHGAGPFGALDQAGNVWEWCEDVWDKKAYLGRDGEKDPVNTRGDTAVRCLRGSGSWRGVARSLAAATRYGVKVSDRSPIVGFRCVLPARPEP
jgi:formylglycine-generating enzyme required for sulfatase activity